MSTVGPHSPPLRLNGGLNEFLAVALTAAALTAALTFPFVVQMAHVGRVDNSDGQFSIWNVAWVARALVVDPRHVFDANIFYPHRWTLAYSESNLGAGVLAVPAYWLTRNPYLAHNFVFVLTFILSACGMYYLVRRLTADRRAALVSAICFAFCPYTFARTSHIQLMMTAGLPFSMLAFHRLVDRPRFGRATALGGTMAAAAVGCGYYGVFVTLMISLSVLVVAATRTQWTSRRYWGSIGIAALAAVAFIAPVFGPYFMLGRATGFARPLEEAVRYSANWPAYLASATFGHAWMLPYVGRFSEVLFPGIVATTFGVAGIVIGARRGGRLREAAILYGTLGALALWASFGPAAGLYRLLYFAIPLFGWLHAPARFGVVVVFALSVLSGVAISHLLDRTARATALAAVLAVLAATELAFPLRFRQVPEISPVYHMLQGLSPAPVIEFPFWWRREELHGHARYMLNSTTHWMPLINGYSDYLPPDFRESVNVLRTFPSAEGFKILETTRPKYAVFHMTLLGDRGREHTAERVRAFSQYLRPLYVDGTTDLYEIVGFPP